MVSPPAASFSRNRAGRMAHGLLVSCSVSPPTGPATAIANCSGSAPPLRRWNSSQAVSKLACSLVLSVTASPRLATNLPSSVAIAKRACVPPMSAATTCFIGARSSDDPHGRASLCFAVREDRAIGLDHLCVKPAAVLDRALLRFEIDVDDAEALGETERPFEIVDQRPGHVAAHVGALADGFVDRAQMALEIVDAERIL